ncbi:MAG: PEP-CTERM sorting domain-containing protein [Planctomycetota bacterium]
MPSIYLTAIVTTVLMTPFASAAVVDFNGVSTTNLPYTEENLTFTNTGDTNPVVIGGADGYLTSGTNVAAIRILVTGSQPFDLESLSFESLTRTWTIESSSGGSLSPAGPGIFDFTSLSGWTNISSFELIHDPGEANGSIRLDDITFTIVPEPTSGVLLLAGSVIALVGRRQLTNQRLQLTACAHGQKRCQAQS